MKTPQFALHTLAPRMAKHFIAYINMGVAHSYCYELLIAAFHHSMQYIPSSTCDCLHSYIIVVDLKFMLLSYHVSGYFYIKNNSCKTYSRCRLVCKFFSMVDCYNMDKHLECSYHLIYYQVSEELGITGCRHLPQWVWTCIHACSLIIIFFFTCKTFCH